MFALHAWSVTYQSMNYQLHWCTAPPAERMWTCTEKCNGSFKQSKMNTFPIVCGYMCIPWSSFLFFFLFKGNICAEMANCGGKCKLWNSYCMCRAFLRHKFPNPNQQTLEKNSIQKLKQYKSRAKQSFMFLKTTYAGFKCVIQLYSTNKSPLIWWVQQVTQLMSTAALFVLSHLVFNSFSLEKCSQSRDYYSPLTSLTKQWPLKGKQGANLPSFTFPQSGSESQLSHHLPTANLCVSTASYLNALQWLNSLSDWGSCKTNQRRT